MQALDLDPADEARKHPDRYLSGYPLALWDLDETIVGMLPRDFERLAEYSATNPTGVIHGKCWKRCMDGNGAAQLHPDPELHWLLCWYHQGPDDEWYIKSRWIKVIGA